MSMKLGIGALIAMALMVGCKDGEGLDKRYDAIASDACKCGDTKCLADVETRLIKLQTAIDEKYPKESEIPADMLRSFKLSDDRYEGCRRKVWQKTDMAGEAGSATLDDAAHDLVKRYEVAADAMCACADPECKKRVNADVDKMVAERAAMATRYTKAAFDKLVELMELHREKLEACDQ